ncbi:hypothetical protein BHE74_00045423 [Ensete ventricosum]|nr:hypothetical protein BHE74_00045423 [Ensete ventricosum]
MAAGRKLLLFRFGSGHERREEHDKGKPSAGSSATSVKRLTLARRVSTSQWSYELLLDGVTHGWFVTRPIYLPDDSNIGPQRSATGTDTFAIWVQSLSFCLLSRTREVTPREQNIPFHSIPKMCKRTRGVLISQGTRNDNCGVGPKAAAVDRGPGPSHIENPVSWLDRNRLAAFTSLLTSPRALMVESRVSVVTKAASRTAAVFCHRPPSGARDAKRACRAYVAPRQRVD